LNIRTAAKALALSVVYGTALLFALAVYNSCRYSNVSTVAVSRLSDLDETFEVGTSRLRVKNPEYLKVCFSGDYVYALKDARQWFPANDIEFAPVLAAAGGPADTYNGSGNSSIVLLSHASAVILQLDWRTEFSVGNLGCANVDAGDIEIKRYQTNSSTELYLPNATLKSPSGPGQSQPTLCAVKLQRFVESMDELFAEQVVQSEPYWAVIRKYLPAIGCRIDEVISITRTSKFLRPQGTDADPIFNLSNSEMRVMFRLESGTGSIIHPYVSSTGLPSF
jgi:hypothetical protein